MIRTFNRKHHIAILLLASSALAISACKQTNDNVTTEEKASALSLSDIDGEFLKTGGDGSTWATYNFNYKEQRFSPLDKINKDNVKDMGIAWYVDMPDQRGHEATPLMVDGVIYVTGAWSKVFAYDALTGDEIWKYDPEVPPETAVNACCDVVNRGVAIWKGKLFFGTLDGRLIALDAKSGAKLWETRTTPKDKPYTITGAPRVVKNKVLIGNGGAEFGVRGFVSAYDVNDGTMKWRFYTTPNPNGEKDNAVSDKVMETASKTWSETGQWLESGGGGTVWDSIVYDDELDQLYIGVGNGNPWNHGARSNGEGDNLFLSSIVALKPDTGEYLWHYQGTPGESWDFTATQHIILADLNIDEQPRKVLMQAPKNGFFYVVDRTNGKLIDAKPFVDGVNWATGYDLETGRPIENPDARFYKTGKLFISSPAAIGAHNWHPMSFSPNTGLTYIPANQIAAGYLPQITELDKTRKPIGFNVGGNLAGFELPEDKAQKKAAIAATTGALVAYDPVKGKVAWKVKYPTPWNGGTLATAGGLVFQGTATGEMRAYDAENGEQLWSYNVQSGVIGGPSTFMVNGEQYLAFFTSKGGAFPLTAGEAGGVSNAVPNIPQLIVMKLGGDKKLPELPEEEPFIWAPPEQFAADEQVKEGHQLYMRYCLVCHGAGAVGGGVTPDLRRSGTIADKDVFASVVYDGALSENGMVSFKPVMDKGQVDLVRAYIIQQAQKAKSKAGDQGGSKKD